MDNELKIAIKNVVICIVRRKRNGKWGKKNGTKNACGVVLACNSCIMMIYFFFKYACEILSLRSCLQVILAIYILTFAHFAAGSMLEGVEEGRRNFFSQSDRYTLERKRGKAPDPNPKCRSVFVHFFWSLDKHRSEMGYRVGGRNCDVPAFFYLPPLSLTPSFNDGARKFCLHPFFFFTPRGQFRRPCFSWNCFLAQFFSPPLTHLFFFSLLFFELFFVCDVLFSFLDAADPMN